MYVGVYVYTHKHIYTHIYIPVLNYDYLGLDTILHIYPSDITHPETLGNGVGQFSLYLP